MDIKGGFLKHKINFMIKKTAFIILILTLLGLQEAKSQNFCFTPAISNNTEINSSSLRTIGAPDYYTLRIYVHVIRRSNHRGGQTPNEVSQALNFLDIDFNPHHIYFQWDNTIDYIDNDSYFNAPNNTIFTVNNHSDGIDIYLFDDSSVAGGAANGVGNSSAFWISGTYWDGSNSSFVRSHAISHEMGHVINLWHTHHGTLKEGSDPNQCAELVNGSNANTCGDYVADTPADPFLDYDINPTACTWNDSGTDSNGDNYDPNEHLIMAYTHPYCMSHFSEGQGQRMRNAIATLPHLINSVIDCQTNYPSNLTITQNVTSGNSDIQIASQSIIASNIIHNNATATYKAGQNITLSSGFHSKNGSSFLASIESCENSQNRALKKTTYEMNIEPVQNSFSIYPNPSKGQFNISVNSNEVKIHDLMGNPIYQGEPGVIDLSEQAEGMYIISWKEKGEVKIEKVVLSK